MPQVTVYVREEDLDAWKAIQRKSEFLSNAINGLSTNGRSEAFEASNPGSSPGEPAMDAKWKSAGEAAKALMTPGCCLDKKNKCKHWEWDGLGSKYINKNTKDEIEVL
jgi:hypothetical protein